MSASRDRVLGVVGPVVGDAGYDLEDLSVMAAGRRRLVRVMIARDAGVDLDDAASMSRRISEALDAAEVMGDTPYVLEVTSPGVDRPLTLPRHWRRATTRLVKVTTADDRTQVGRVVTAADHAAVLDVDGAEVVFAYDDVVKAIMQVEFNRPVQADPTDASGEKFEGSDDEAEATLEADEMTGRG